MQSFLANSRCLFYFEKRKWWTTIIIKKIITLKARMEMIHMLKWLILGFSVQEEGYIGSSLVTLFLFCKVTEEWKKVVLLNWKVVFSAVVFDLADNRVAIVSTLALTQLPQGSAIQHSTFTFICSLNVFCMFIFFYINLFTFLTLNSHF